MTSAPKRHWLPIIFQMVGLTSIVLLLALVVFLPQEVRWSREREQFAREHYASHLSFGLDHLYNRPLGSPPMTKVILNRDATDADLARARYLFPEVKYLGQFTTEQAQQNSRVGKKFAPDEVRWFGKHPHRTQ